MCAGQKTDRRDAGHILKLLIGRSRIQTAGAKDARGCLENQKTVFHFRTGDGGWMFV
jgi:hypothetical protein